MLLYANPFAATRPEIIVAHDLPVGAILTAANVEVTHARVGDDIYAAIAGDELSAVLGRSLAEPAYAQQILVSVQVSERPHLGAEWLALAIVQARMLVSAKPDGDPVVAFFRPLLWSRVSAVSSVDLDHCCRVAAGGRS